MTQNLKKQSNPNQTYRQMKLLLHMLRVLGYQRLISLDSFRKPNFKLIADILFWLCNKMDPNNGISTNINGESERVFFIKNTLSLLVSKTRINIDPKLIYYSDYRCISELLKIVKLLYKGYEGDQNESNKCGDFTLPSKFDKRQTKDLAKEITQHGHVLYEILGKKEILEEKMDNSISILENVQKEYNTSSVSLEKHMKTIIDNQKQYNEEISVYMKNLEKKEKDLLDRIRRKKIEVERMEKKIRTLSNIKPAYMEEMERYESELERLFQVYLNKMRNLDFLENCFDKINISEQKKNKDLLKYLEKMQVQIQQKEEQMFEQNIDDVQIRNMNNYTNKFNHQNPIQENPEEELDDDELEEDQDYVF